MIMLLSRNHEGGEAELCSYGGKSHHCHLQTGRETGRHLHGHNSRADWNPQQVQQGFDDFTASSMSLLLINYNIYIATNWLFLAVNKIQIYYSITLLINGKSMKQVLESFRSLMKCLTLLYSTRRRQLHPGGNWQQHSSTKLHRRHSGSRRLATTIAKTDTTAASTTTTLSQRIPDKIPLHLQPRSSSAADLPGCGGLCRNEETAEEARKVGQARQQKVDGFRAKCFCLWICKDEGWFKCCNMWRW